VDGCRKAPHINQLRRFVVALEAGGGTAVYDATTYLTPACLAVGRVCDSANLLIGRDTIVNGAEVHQPNTIGNSCADGASGTFHVNASNDRVRVSTVDGTPFAPDKIVRIEAFVWAIGTANNLDLYFAASAASPSWTLVATINATVPGPQTLSAAYVLPAGSIQAVRARFRSGGTQMPCTGNSTGFDDHDDLVFAVGP
jgi:bacterial leucyl aminopeptidase